MTVHRAPLWRRVAYVTVLGAAALLLVVRTVAGDLPAVAAVAVLPLAAAVWRVWVSRVAPSGDGARNAGLPQPRYKQDTWSHRRGG